MKETLKKYLAPYIRRPYRSRIKKVKVRGVDILMEIRSKIDLLRAKTYSEKEPETLDWIDSFKNNSTIIYYDIGANIGVYSLYPAKKYGKKIKAYAFDPMSQNFSSLSNNIYINELSDIVEPYCMAISDTSDIKKLFIPFNRFRSGGNRSQFGGNINHATKVAGKGIIHTEGAFSTSIDDLFGKFDFPIPNYIKIDVDGIELQILQGAVNVLAHQNVKSVLVELGNTADDIHKKGQKIFEQSGFKRTFSGKYNEIYEK